MTLITTSHDEANPSATSDGAAASSADKTDKEISPHYQLGLKGEELALKHLQQQGLQILEQRWKHHAYEIDIIAFDPSTVEMVFVEVKTRSSEKWGYPEQAIDLKKIRRCIRAANFYLRSRHITHPTRFDVYAIILTPSGKETIEYIKNAFYPPLG